MLGGFAQGFANSFGSAMDSAMNNRLKKEALAQQQAQQQQRLLQDQEQFQQQFNMQQQKFQYQQEQDKQKFDFEQQKWEVESKKVIAETAYQWALTQQVAQSTDSKTLDQMNKYLGAVNYSDDPSIAYEKGFIPWIKANPNVDEKIKAMFPEKYDETAKALVSFGQGLTGDAKKLQQMQYKPASELGKLNQDMQAGAVSQEQGTAAINKMTESPVDVEAKKNANESYDAAQSVLTTLNQLESNLAEVPGYLKGPIAGKAAPYAPNFLGGGKAQAAASSAKTLALQIRSALKMIGSMSDADRKYLDSIAGGIEVNPDAADQIIKDNKERVTKIIQKAIEVNPKLQKHNQGTPQGSSKSSKGQVSVDQVISDGAAKNMSPSEAIKKAKEMGYEIIYE